MDTTHWLRILLRRFLAPSFLSTFLWIAIDYLELPLGGLAMSVLFALAYPVLEVSHEAVMAYRLQRQSVRRNQLLTTFLPFFNAYVQVLSKYPPGVLQEAQHAASAHIDLLAAHLRPLKERRLPQTANPYELVQAAALAPRDFASWRLADVETWQQQVLDELRTEAMPALTGAIEHFQHDPDGRAWAACLAAAEQELDRQVTQTLHAWRCVQQARQDPAIQERLLTFLRLDAINRQARLQTYMAARPLCCTPAEVATMVASLRYEAVATQLCTLLGEPCVKT